MRVIAELGLAAPTSDHAEAIADAVRRLRWALADAGGSLAVIATRAEDYPPAAAAARLGRLELVRQEIPRRAPSPLWEAADVSKRLPWRRRRRRGD